MVQASPSSSECTSETKYRDSKTRGRRMNTKCKQDSFFLNDSKEKVSAEAEFLIEYIAAEKVPYQLKSRLFGTKS
jgi:hypothetical protein